MERVPSIYTDLVERELLIHHQGKKVLLHDYSGLHGWQAEQTVSNHGAAVIARNQRNLLLLVDVTDGAADRRVLQAFKREAQRNAPYIKKVAVVGAVGVLEFFLHLVSEFSGLTPRPFATRSEAIDWLVSEDE